MSNYVVNPIMNPTHPLIPREQTYLLDRKIVSIHSEDRDISQWPNPNHFEVTLPEDLINIQSMRLVNSIFPSNQYVFENNYQNTKFMFSVIPDPATGAGEIAAINAGNPFTGEISEGFYDPEQLATELTNTLNETVNDVINPSFPPTFSTYDHFTARYNKIKHKIFIGNDRDDFTLDFSANVPYDISCGQPIVWPHYAKWGLPYYLGYKKEDYPATDISSGGATKFTYAFKYDGVSWLFMDPSNSLGLLYVSEPPCALDIFGENAMYMEMNKYNSIDEIDPYSENTIGEFNNDYHGRVNSAFVKIPLVQFPFSQMFDSRNAFLSNIKVFNPPLPKLRKMKFKIRYHDGRLVEFRCMPFSFSIEVNQLRDEQRRCLSVRVPEAYLL